MFAPRGQLTFATDVEMIVRAAPLDRPDFNPPLNPANDLKLSLNFSGPTVTPTFFPYELADLTGWLEYKNNRVDLVSPLVGRHGDTQVRLNGAEVRFFPDGVIWANLGGLEMKPFVADAAFIKALPGKLGPGLDELKLRGGAELLIKHLVILTPPDSKEAIAKSSPQSPPQGNQEIKLAGGPTPVPSLAIPEPDPVVYFDAEVKLAGASLDTGVDWKDVFGAVACRGRYEGTHMGLLRGAMWFDRATIAKQPVTRVSGRVQGNAAETRPDSARRLPAD